MDINTIISELDVDPCIHAAGTKTWYGGTQLSENVLATMRQATDLFCNVHDLNRAVGKYICSITGAEAAMVTAGCASSVIIATAVCMTRHIPKAISLPREAEQCRHEIIVQKNHIGQYSFLIEHAGASAIEVGTVNGCSQRQLEEAITERTGMIKYLFGPGINQNGLRLSEVKAIANRYDIPIVVNAAAMLPPKTNLRRFINEGADLVCMSGGKVIRGPQDTGLLFGNQQLIDKAYNFASPNLSIGRAQKVSKEAIAGLYVALKEYMATDEKQMIATMINRVKRIRTQLSLPKAVVVNIEHDDVRYFIPTLTLQLDKQCFQHPADAYAKSLIQAPYRLFVRSDRWANKLEVNPFSVKDEQLDRIACILNKFFEGKKQ